MTHDNTEGELTELDDKIIGTIKSEFKRPEEIAEITGFTLPQVIKRLREFVADEVVSFVGAGHLPAQSCTSWDCLDWPWLRQLHCRLVPQ